jgi:hypothetical protein
MYFFIWEISDSSDCEGQTSLDILITCNNIMTKVRLAYSITIHFASRFNTHIFRFLTFYFYHSQGFIPIYDLSHTCVCVCVFLRTSNLFHNGYFLNFNFARFYLLCTRPYLANLLGNEPEISCGWGLGFR